MPRENTQDNIRASLRIDEDNIDRCLMQQPDLFYMAASAVALANAERDGLKLELAELNAKLDGDIRKQLTDLGEKYSEASLSNRLKTLPKIMELHRRYLGACLRADEAEAVKESFQQRSYMLRELNSSAQSRMYNLGVERGATTARNRVVERGAEAASRSREDAGVFDRRERGAPERYRPTAKKDQTE
jgi:hypothetical protein